MPNKKDSLPPICDLRSLSAFLGWPLSWLMDYWDKKRILHSPSRLIASHIWGGIGLSSWKKSWTNHIFGKIMSFKMYFSCFRRFQDFRIFKSVKWLNVLQHQTMLDSFTTKIFFFALFLQYIFRSWNSVSQLWIYITYHCLGDGVCFSWLECVEFLSS